MTATSPIRRKRKRDTDISPAPPVFEDPPATEAVDDIAAVEEERNETVDDIAAMEEERSETVDDSAAMEEERSETVDDSAAAEAEPETEASPIEATAETVSEDEATEAEEVRRATHGPTEVPAPDDLQRVLESLIFAADQPLTMHQMRRITGAPTPTLSEALREIQEAFDQRGMQLVEVGGGFQFRTHPRNGNWVGRLIAVKPQRLTRPMLETLSIVAYRQPVTRPEIEDVRGVDCGNTLRVLLERNLLRIIGKKEDVGRPLLYGTTKQFLELFHLKDLKALPTLRQFAELSAEHQQQVEVKFGSAPTGETTTESAAPTGADGAPLEAPPGDTSPQDEAGAQDLLSTGKGNTETGQLSPLAAAAPLEPEGDDTEALEALEQAMSRIDALVGHDDPTRGPRAAAEQASTAQSNEGGVESTTEADDQPPATTIDDAEPEL